MPDPVAIIKSTVQGVKFENTGEEILIRFERQERIEAHELNLVWDELMYWTRAVADSNKKPVRGLVGLHPIARNAPMT
jgi:hypothetical protein